MEMMLRAIYQTFEYYKVIRKNKIGSDLGLSPVKFGI